MITVFNTSISEQDIKSVTDVMNSGWVGRGSVVERFESMLSEYTGKKHVICCNSGTTALMLSILSSYSQDKRRIGFPAYGMMAGANVARLLGKTVRLFDVDDGFYGDARNLRDSDNCDCVVLINHNGKTPPPSNRMCKTLIIEDAATSIGIPGTFSYGHLCTVSFSPQKLITTGQGGAVLTDDAELARRVRGFLDHGGQWRKTGIHDAGGNFRMSDINAALGVSQLSNIERLLARRRAIHARYKELISVDCGWAVIYQSEHAKHISDHLESCDIQSLMPYGRNCESLCLRDEFDNANRAANELLYIPSHNGLTDHDIDIVCGSVQDSLGSVSC